MFERVTIRASRVAESQRFYRTVLEAIGVTDTPDFGVVQADATYRITRGLHIAFGVPDHALVDAFWRAGIEAGFESDGEPGPRPVYAEDYYGGFLLDPDGNSAEAVFHGRANTNGIDHLWIRVAHVEESKRFYETIAPKAGLSLRTETPDRAQFVVSGASFSVVEGAYVTENVHMALRAAEPAVFTDPDGNIVELIAGDR